MLNFLLSFTVGLAVLTAAPLACSQTAPRAFEKTLEKAPAETFAKTAAPHQAPSSFADPALEARVLVIAEELRCLVCQNETIAASHADLAIDLRKQIRTKLTEGQSQQQILDFMADRYGDFVLYRPRLKASTLMLWAGPFVLLLVAFAALAVNIRQRRRSAVKVDLSPAEAEHAQRLLYGTANATSATTTTTATATTASANTARGPNF